MKVQREWANFGQWESGDVVVSVGSDTPLYAAGEMDRIVFTQSSESFDYIQSRGAATEWALLAPAPATVSAADLPVSFNAPRQATAAFPVVAFDRCFWLTDAGDAIIEGGLPVQGTDGTLSWPNGGAPPLGRQYTLRGRKRPEYFIFKDFALDRAHFGGLALPRRLALRKWSLFPV